MGKEFKRLKRYNATWRLFRTLAVGAALAMLMIGIVMILSKLRMMEAGALHYGICVVISVVVAGVYWLLQRRTDLRIAEKIDMEHKLRERVQTMVEYRDADSAMLQVQREDTEARLKAVRRFGQRRLTLAAHFVMLCLAFVVFMAGTMLPVQAVPPETVPTEPPYEVSQWQKAAVEELIEHVQQSNMVASVKELTVQDLQDLRSALETRMTATMLKNRVKSVIINVYRNTDDANSNDDIYNLIFGLVRHDQAADLAYALGAPENVERPLQLEQIRQALEQAGDQAQIGSLAEQLTVALTTSLFDESDALYAAVAAFAVELKAVSEAASAEDSQMLLGSAFGTLKNSANNAMEQQDATKEECVYVVDKLCEIFGISGKDRPADSDEEIEKKEQSSGDGSSSGGHGTGETEYASDDEVYDYRNHTYEAYGELFTEHYWVQALEDMKGLSDEASELVEKYIQEILVKKDEEGNP